MPSPHRVYRALPPSFLKAEHAGRSVIVLLFFGGNEDSFCLCPAGHLLCLHRGRRRRFCCGACRGAPRLFHHPWTRGDRSAGGDRVCECGGVLPAIPFMDHGGHAPGLIASAFRAFPWPAPRYPATGCAAAFYGGKAFPCSLRRQGNRSSLPQSVPGADKM